jgi:hypothetical protein
MICTNVHRWQVTGRLGPNVEGNRRAGRMRAEDQVAHRRVRLTERLGDRVVRQLQVFADALDKSPSIRRHGRFG